MTLVIDASTALAWFFNDEANNGSDAVLERVEKFGAAVPLIWRLKIANGFRTAIRRRRLTQPERDAALAKLSALQINDDTETTVRAWTSIVAVSDRYDLTHHDAAYLELAIRLGADFATRDEKLEAAARAAGLTTVPC